MPDARLADARRMMCSLFYLFGEGVGFSIDVEMPDARLADVRRMTCSLLSQFGKWV